MKLADLPIRFVSNDRENQMRRKAKRYGSYEQEKRLWVARHPDATPEQYQVAMTRLAQKCGV